MGIFVSESCLMDMLNRIMSVNYELCLYKNDYQPSPQSTIDDFVEADFTGYQRRPLYSSSWSDAAIDDERAITTYPRQMWTSSGNDNTIYGYYVIESGRLAWSRRITPRLLAGNNASLAFSPIFVLRFDY